jgi:hypothetical protein
MMSISPISERVSPAEEKANDTHRDVIAEENACLLEGRALKSRTEYAGFRARSPSAEALCRAGDPKRETTSARAIVSLG